METKKVIKFWAPWCGPCKSYEPIFKKVSNKYRDQIEFVEINIDTDSPEPAQYKVRSIPYTVFIKEDGSIVTKSGRISEQQLEELILT
tara:strand:+ start:9447 stop:9710 length:264 start_codon:yes stop_codon:yes gene_type:complete